MRTLAQLILVFLVVTTLPGCIAGKEQYDSYLSTKLAQAQQEAVEAQKRSERWQAMAEACKGDSACIREVSRDSVLSDAVAALEKSGSGGSDSIQQFQVQAHPATAALTSLGGIALQQGIQAYAQVETVKTNARVSMADIAARADTNRAAFALGEAAVNGVANTSTSFANILPGLAPTQTYTSGGPMSLGNMNIGDQAGRDNVRDGSQVGHSGPINTGTQNTNGVIGAGQIGSGRQNSAGPYRLTDVANVGPRCDGENCQRVPLPEPEEPEDE
jgi:uncharacterized protein